MTQYDSIQMFNALSEVIRQSSDIMHSKSQNLHASYLALQLSLPNPLKWRIEMQLLQLYLSDQQFYCLLRCTLY